MEEIDKIIIETLNHLECNLSEEIDSLKKFDADMVLAAISSCLKSIKPELKFPKLLPPSMTQRLKVATDIAQEIKTLGFRGDMGYQTILYCNEVEVRRVLMFLIERLPRDTSKLTQIEQTGYVPRLVKQIEDNLKNYNKLWIPSNLLHLGARECSSGYIMNSFGDSCPPNPQTLIVPDSRNLSHDLKQYYVHHVPDVTKQCLSRHLIPSLLFNDVTFEYNDFNKNILKGLPPKLLDDTVNTIEDTLPETTIQVENNKQANNATINTDKLPNKSQSIATKIKDQKQTFKSLQESVQQLEIDLEKIQKQKDDEEELLKSTKNKIRLKTKTLAVVNNKENIHKLKNKIDEANAHLIDLANQWNKVQTPLLEEYRSLVKTSGSEEQKQQQHEANLHNLKNIRKSLLNDIREKELLEENLTAKCQQLNKNNSRSSYTRRILEIIGNIRKQNNEIQKVLKDTRDVQKDINNLTGQVDRSFTLSDEIIFYDAKKDETARKAYKLLAALRDEWNGTLEAVGDLGLTERESRNLQEQVETEKAKENAEKLERVTKDLEEIRKETKNMKT